MSSSKSKITNDSSNYKMTDDSSRYKMTDLYVALALTFIVVLITYLLSKRLKKTINVVLLTGLSDSGKTAIFSKIIFNKPKKSVTSLKENEATINELNLKLIDLPGADRLRDRYWEQYRDKARHVIFTIDSTSVESRIRDLTCNKQDLEGAKKKDVVKLMLEKELNAIRGTKTGQLAKTSNEEEEDYLAKLDVEQISLDSLKVNLIETSVHNPEQLIKLIL